MENQQPPSFSTLELVKMSNLIADAMAKISVVTETLFKAGDTKNTILMLQAWDNLSRVHAKLSGLSRAKAKQQAKKTLEKAREILGEK
ncbi:MAG: hypothetical protein QXZ68_08010 [Candidatus Bathyarchaeia archaeon]